MSVTLKDLKKIYTGPDGSTVPVIDVPELHVADGEQLALIGTSGSGKTTLLHLIAGILTPDSGWVIFDKAGESTLPTDSSPSRASRAVQQGLVLATTGMFTYPFYRLIKAMRAKERGDDQAPVPRPPRSDRPLSNNDGAVLEYDSGLPSDSINIGTLSEAERDIFRGQNIGYIFQTHHLLPGFTALENVLLGMSFTGRPHDPNWAKQLLTEVGLGERLHYKPGKLSVGQQQRVAVARALANRPRLVLADEPTGALDPRNAQQVLELIRKLCTQVNAALILVSHDLAIANQLPRVLSLSDVNRASTAATASASAEAAAVA